MLIGIWSIAVVVVVVSCASGGDAIVTPSQQQVPCYFIFGDSLADNGNNNNLPTQAKANYQPYGVDFAGGVPTGRFTNNRTFVDVISQLLGFPSFIPRFSRSMTVAEASGGVNYASGGAGILYETARLNLGPVISFREQIQNHLVTVAKLGNQVNLSKCLYTINIGNNDYINNYFKNKTYPATSLIFTPDTYATFLIHLYRVYTLKVYALGARKIAFHLLGQIGCSLGEIVAFNATGCVESVNDAVALFNNKLVPMVTRLNSQLRGARFTIINSTAIDISAYTGITVFTSSCCTPRSDGQCQEGTTPCTNRDEYYFWDLFHPTDAVSKVVGGRAYKANSVAEAFPYDISTLVQL